ncbi:DNA internalization-related competence protein ComEC/Rec2 [Ectobacillus ponti]|uniref:DNA internalization-related competence protein ComEC/Rec2 n=1 Tax=Ectobacillus ponti TaxID=2961894 RepID=A0AA41X4T0_9BACI|nr:DNA internalization-related competence protein ComEC/Rec2 [Ectobacillus ponti]MCP8967188.1 DNA internalization-related competence protein ComEC/Rec2 [Ectobacillus ponti]
MREQWCYIAAAWMLGIAVTMLHLSAASLGVAALYGIYCVFCLRRLTAAAAGIAFAISLLYCFWTEQYNKPAPAANPGSFQAVFTGAPQIDGDRLSAALQTKQGEKLRLTYMISSPAEKERLGRLRAGTTCSFTGERTVPDGARNFRAFDYAGYLRRQEVHYLFQAASLSSCSMQQPSFTQWLFSVRQAAVDYVHRTFPGETAGFINSLVYGDRQDLSQETEASYQQLGLIHLLAISGSHISLLTAGCYYILLRCGLTRETTTVLLLLVVPLYMFLAGASPSVIRASLAAIIVLGCTLSSKRISGMDALSITALCMLAWNPYLLYDIGFQFSFLSAAALLLSARTILAEGNGMLKNLLYVAVVAQLVALPVTLHHFGQFSPYGILLNLLYVPFLSFLIMPLCLLTLGAAAVIPAAGKGLAAVLGWLLSVSHTFLQWCEQLPLGNLVFGQSPWWLTLLYAAALLWLLAEWERKGRYQLVSWLLFLSMMAVHYFSDVWNPYGRVTFLDVGQGDCAVIQLPRGSGTYVIDTGGTITLPKKEWQKRKRTYEVGRDTVLPYLRSHGIKKIDKLILTHGDYDHMGAAASILGGIPVKEVWLGSKKTYTELETGIAKLAQETGSRLVQAQGGMDWQAGDAVFRILAPTGTDLQGNDASIVMRAEMGGLSWMFTGDLEEEGEQRLIRQHGDLRTDVLKAGHHGSETSTTAAWLQALQPRIAVISAGQKNRYGHPHVPVLKRLQELNVQVLRTDRSGAITYVFRGRSGTFRTALTYDDSTEQENRAK